MDNTDVLLEIAATSKRAAFSQSHILVLTFQILVTKKGSVPMGTWGVTKNWGERRVDRGSRVWLRIWVSGCACKDTGRLLFNVQKCSNW